MHVYCTVEYDVGYGNLGGSAVKTLGISQFLLVSSQPVCCLLFSV